MGKYSEFFAKATNGKPPRWWQDENDEGIAAQETCGNRLIRIPTGFGKTLGVLLVWLWRAVDQKRTDWPRRLVLTLPMRVLVEQTQKEVRDALSRLNLLWDGKAEHTGKVGVHVLMGGADSGEWYLYPEQFAVLICTQDMGLSAALNRAYGGRRARWPALFGLLNQDALWVMDEVQLMDVGLATSAQLQAFREDDAAKGRSLRPCHTWWMSATLQFDWLAKSPDTNVITKDLPQTCIPKDRRHGELWDDVSKPCHTETCNGTPALTDLVARQHVEHGKGTLGPTLVVVNRVESAVKIYKAVKKDPRLEGTDIRLVHSRFRPHERTTWRDQFLNRSACAPGTDRIIVATQVVEAGVDISAALLITELAPWASLVQRFGRCARWGGSAQVVVADFGYADEKDAGKGAPYSIESLVAARKALSFVPDVAPLHLETFEEAHPELLPELYPYQPKHLLLRHELDELFDTTADLSGADIDISRFIRSGKERDVHVFWVAVPYKQPPPNRKPLRDELCAVPFLKARDWLFDSSKSSGKTLWKGFKKDKRAWVWDWQQGAWKLAEASDVYPGRSVLVAATSGGYDIETGWSESDTTAVRPLDTKQVQDYIEVACWKEDADGNTCESHQRRRRYAGDVYADADDDADASEDNESLSQSRHDYQTIAFHGRETGKFGAELAQSLIPARAALFDLAGRWHDAGKAHAAFQASIRHADKPDRHDLAKAPDAAWPCSPRNYYRISRGESRRGFRHELASTLMLFGVLQRHAPDHPVLLGPWRELLHQAGMPPIPQAPADPPNALEREIIQLDADDFNLLAYLVCTHHGKVRMSWHASPADQTANAATLRIRGVVDGDIVPPLCLADNDDGFHTLPASRLDLAPASAGLHPATGIGWTERVLGLLDRHGPFALAWLESLLIAADRRASRLSLVDPLLTRHNAAHGLETDNPALARASGNGETPHSLATHPAQRGGEHGFRARAGEPDHAGSGTRPPAYATRHVQTRLGTLSYAELAPYLAREVQTLEQAIEEGQFDARSLDDTLIDELHRRICAELTPQLVGWRRHDVTVGTHTPPDYFQVPVLVREYARDLVARLDTCASTPDDRLLETLAFAEGRLLSIHPFADFNGRATRVWLRLLSRRLDLPWVDLLPSGGEEKTYLAALRAGDHNDWQPLIDIWRHRFTAENAS